LKNVGWFNDKKLFQTIEEIFNDLGYKSRLKASKTGRGYFADKGLRRKEILASAGNLG